MNNVLLRRKIVGALHRWIGAAAALFLLVLSLTGLSLNHAERLGLNSRVVQLPFILERYNMESPDSIRSLRLGEGLVVSELQGTIFLNSTLLENIDGRLIRTLTKDRFNIVVLDSGVALVTPDGDLIEFLSTDVQPFGKITAVGESPEGEAVLITASGNWRPDGDWVTFHEYPGAVSTGMPNWVELDTSLSTAILETYNGKGPTLYRVLLDLHAGRLFGWGGRTLMDLTAVAIVILVISGFSSWIGRSRGPTRRIR